jgi:hypothetical protein
VDENFKRANMRDAAKNQKFFFRTNVYEGGKPVVEELSIREIFEGRVNRFLTKGTFKGLNKLQEDFFKLNVDNMLEEMKLHNVTTNSQARLSFRFLTDTASGAMPTTSRILRDFIDKHPLYQHDSLLSEVAGFLLETP